LDSGACNRRYLPLEAVALPQTSRLPVIVVAAVSHMPFSLQLYQRPVTPWHLEEAYP